MNVYKWIASRYAHTFVVSLIVLSPLAAARHASGQEAAGPPKSALLGGWSLNRELSASAPAPEDAGRGRGYGEPGGGRPGGPGGRQGGPGGGFGGPSGGLGGPSGGFGGPGGGFGGPGGGPGGPGGGFDPKKIEAAMAIMRELMTPSAHVVVTGDSEIVTLTDADGRSARYATNGKKEKHQFSNASVETKTTWESGQLRQELSLPEGMKALRVFSVTEGDTTQLIVTITPQGGPEGRGGRRPPLRFVYDRDR